MPKKRDLTEVERGQIVLLASQMLSMGEIANQMKCSKCAVFTTLKRHKELGSLKNRPRSGRKRITTHREDQLLVRNSLKNREKTSDVLAADLKDQTGVTLSARTVRQRLQDHGLKGCKARKKPFLNERNKKARLDWAKNYKNWTFDDWKNVLWSDETNIEVFDTAGATYVQRRVGEAYKPACLVPTVKFGGGSVMLWGCMGPSGVGKHFICEGRMNSQTYTSMLDEVLRPSIDQVFPNQPRETIHYQQDNAPCHTSKVSRTWFKNNHIKVLPWPAQSPDLNPIEHLWGMVKKAVRKHNASSRAELKRIIAEEWFNIPQSDCENLIRSMPSRIKAVIKAKGWGHKILILMYASTKINV